MKAAVIEPLGGYGGLHYYDVGLCGGLAEAGIQVRLYTCDDTVLSGAERPYDVETTYRRIYGSDPVLLRGLRYLVGSLRSLIRARRWGATIVHFHVFHVGFKELFNLIVARFLRFRVVVTAHDVQSFVPHLAIPAFTRFVYRTADRVIVHNESSKQELLDLVGLPSERVCVIHSGNYLHVVDHSVTCESARAALGLPREVPVLLFFGLIKQVKGLDVLLRALPAVVRAHPEVRLVIAGREWKDRFETYQTIMRELGIEDHCLAHLGHIPDELLTVYYKAADVVVLPYRRSYQSAVVLMAMSMGTTVVASDLSSMRQVIEDGVTGYLFRSGDADALAAQLTRAVGAPVERERLAAHAATRMREQYTWNRVGVLTAECYVRLSRDRA